LAHVGRVSVEPVVGSQLSLNDFHRIGLVIGDQVVNGIVDLVQVSCKCINGEFQGQEVVLLVSVSSELVAQDCLMSVKDLELLSVSSLVVVPQASCIKYEMYCDVKGELYCDVKDEMYCYVKDEMYWDVKKEMYCSDVRPRGLASAWRPKTQALTSAS